ncbi:hypothetical protein [Azospirillum argentinense]|uniref:hypothetical protein n=1 Tax=Azospirillum argentinense TaxID=2970906 RepID=UPI0032E00002
MTNIASVTVPLAKPAQEQKVLDLLRQARTLAGATTVVGGAIDQAIRRQERKMQLTTAATELLGLLKCPFDLDLDHG